MPRLLLLVPTTSYRISDFLGAARRLDVEVTVGSNRRQVLEKFSPGRTVTLDFRNSEKGTKQIIDFARRYLSRLSSRSMKTPRCWRLRPLRPWACCTIRPAPSGCREQISISNSSRGSWPPSPGFTVVSREDDPAEVAHRVEYPCVLKPLALSASRGVIRADDPAGFAAAFYRIGRILNDAYAGSLAGTGDCILVEDYIQERRWRWKACWIVASSASWHFSTSPILSRARSSKKPYT